MKLFLIKPVVYTCDSNLKANQKSFLAIAEKLRPTVYTIDCVKTGQGIGACVNISLCANYSLSATKLTTKKIDLSTLDIVFALEPT